MDLVHQAAVAFLQADANGDQQLDFEEFKDVLPENMKGTDEEIKEIFDMADADGSGAITQDEFFFWSVQIATQHGGMGGKGLDDLFRKFDSTGDGHLNSLEFRNAVEPFGFGNIAQQIFNELDQDGTGTVSYAEILRTLKDRRVEVSGGCKKLLTSMSFDLLDRDKKEVVFDKTRWTAAGGTDREVFDVVHARLGAKTAKPYDLWKAFIDSAGAKKKLRKPQWFVAMGKVLGYAGEEPHIALAASFSEMDGDNSGLISFEQYLAWVNGRAPKARQRLLAKLTLPTSRTDKDLPLREIKWSFGTLRTELQKMLIRNGVLPLDLLSCHDKSADGNLSKKEFIVMMKKVVGDVDVWDRNDIKGLITSLYESIAGDDDLDIEELERWILKDWLESQRQCASESAPITTKDASTMTDAADLSSEPLSASYANQAAAQAQAEAVRFLNTSATLNQGQNVRLKIIQQRKLRESLVTPPIGSARPSPVLRMAKG